ncbi:MFS transporter [Nocardiopsis sp. CNT-189]|uniref:MFS transporter n=1 Tax=Nocardiopsis oceanisediminis TaxID=2816862 RepID=UPI003B347298
MAERNRTAKTTAPTPARAEDARYGRWRLQIFGVTWLVYAAFYFSRNAFAAAKVGILDDPSSSLTQAVLGNLDALYLAAYAAGQFFWGALADRFGPRAVVTGGLLMSAVAALLMGLAPALALFAPLMVVQGLAQSTGWASLCKNMASFFSVRERGRVLGFWSTNYAFGGLVAAPFTGWWAYSVFDHWSAAFYAGAAVVLAALLVFLLLQRNRPEDVGLPPIEEHRASTAAPAPPDAGPADPADQASGAPAAAVPRPRPPADDGPAPPHRPGVRGALAGAVRNRMVLMLGLSYFLLKPARYAILLWGPVIVAQRIPQASNLEAVVIPVAFGAAGLAAPIAIGYVSDRLLGARRIPSTVLSLGLLVVALALFEPLTASGSIPVMVAVLALIGLAAYAADTMISCTAAVDFGTSERAGSSAGFINGCGSIGAILGGLLPGYFGSGVLFHGFAAAALLSGLVLLPWWNKMPEAD